jgi:sRNA-binding protein
MNNSFGHIPKETLDLVYSEAERAERTRRNQEAKARRAKAREEKLAAIEKERSNRPKKTWGNFLR